MERIIVASSNEGDVVLDPFCGCATTIEAAHRLNRKWIGIDIAIHAIKRVVAVRLAEKLGLVERARLRLRAYHAMLRAHNSYGSAISTTFRNGPLNWQRAL